MASAAVSIIYPAPSSEHWEDDKTAYTEWAHMMGLSQGFEQLSNREISAWCKVAKALRDVIEDEWPVCDDCKSDMACPECNDLTCSTCGALAAEKHVMKVAASMPGGPLGDLYA